VAAAWGIDANAVREWRDRHAAVGEAGLSKATKAEKRLNRAIFDGSHKITFATFAVIH
jgi:hypothetical protein